MYHGAWMRHLVRGELASALEVAEKMISEVARRPESTEAGVAHRVMGSSLEYDGQFAAAISHYEQSLKILELSPNPQLLVRFAEDPTAAGRIRLGIDRWTIGDWSRARAVMDQAVNEAKRGDHPGSICYVLGWKGILEAIRRAPDLAEADTDVLLELAEERGVRGWVPAGALVNRWARSRLGGEKFGVELFRQGCIAMEEVGHQWILRAPFAALAAEAEASEGRIDEALAVLDEALTQSDRTGFRWHDAELHRVRGNVLSKLARADLGAEQEFEAAIEIANHQGARSFVLRAALALAKLYQSTARPVEAHDILAPALEGFAPTPEMPEIAEGQALLEALADTDVATVRM